jgi:hypothetical protein
VERELLQALESLEKQKAEAKRWLLRQQVRLEAQAEEVQREKSVVAELLEQELSYFRMILYPQSKEI